MVIFVFCSFLSFFAKTRCVFVVVFLRCATFTSGGGGGEFVSSRVYTRPRPRVASAVAALCHFPFVRGPRIPLRLASSFFFVAFRFCVVTWFPARRYVATGRDASRQQVFFEARPASERHCVHAGARIACQENSQHQQGRKKRKILGALVVGEET